MNPTLTRHEYEHIETVLSDKRRNDSVVLYQSSSYDINIKVWEELGGDAPEFQQDERLLDDYVENWRIS